MSREIPVLLGEIRAFATEQLPAGWMPCDGRSLVIREYVDLFSLIGTAYGGDGISHFPLPDLRGRSPAGWDGAHHVGSVSGIPGTADTGLLPTTTLTWAIAVKGFPPPSRD